MVFFDSCFYQTLKYFYLKKSKNVSFWNIFYSFFVNFFRQGQSFLRRCQTLTLKENVGKKTNQFAHYQPQLFPHPHWL